MTVSNHIRKRETIIASLTFPLYRVYQSAFGVDQTLRILANIINC